MSSISKPGVYYNLTRREYDAIEALNQSTLKAFAKNPQAWRDGLPRKESDAFLWGDLFESLLFYGDNRWPNQFACLDEATQQRILADANSRQTRKSTKFSKNLGEYRSWKTIQEQAGKTIIDEATLKSCVIARERAIREPNIKGLLDLGGEAQVGIVWRDPDTELLCKGLIDWVPEGIASLVDVKTTKDVIEASSEDAKWHFARSVRKYGYDVQASFYIDGWNLAHEQAGILMDGIHMDPRSGWLFVVSGNAKPWPAAAYRLSDESIDAGYAKYKHALHLWKSCQESGHFPGLTTDEQWPELPTLKSA